MNFPQNCCVCWQNGVDFSKISSGNVEKPEILSKLRQCVPELDWDENFVICPTCSSDLNVIHSFRLKCLETETIRKLQSEISTNEILDTDPPCDDNSRFSCDYCNNNFVNVKELVLHVKEEHKGNKPFCCKICGKTFARSSNLRQHLKYHDGNRTQICTFCGKSYITKSDLIMHEKIHLNKREYNCDICLKSFNTCRNLRSHKLVVHSDPATWNFVCSVCGKRFPIKSNYDSHMRRHNDDRRFSCHLCEKKFIDKCVLQRHYRSHSNVRSFSCSVCGTEYKDRGVMGIHMAKIHGIGDVKVPLKVKNYFCHICPKSFCAKNKLTRHLCTHTGEKPFFCVECDKKFTDVSYLNQHMKKTHNVVDNETN